MSRLHPTPKTFPPHRRLASPAELGLILASRVRRLYLPGVTTDSSAQAVSGFIYYGSDISPESQAAKPSNPILTDIVLGGKITTYFTNTYDANNFISVQHKPGLADVFRLNLGGFDLTLTSRAGRTFGDTSLDTELNRELFDTATLTATISGVAYNINVTQFGSTVPEHSTLFMTGIAASMSIGLRWNRRRHSNGARSL